MFCNMAKNQRTDRQQDHVETTDHDDDCCQFADWHVTTVAMDASTQVSSRLSTEATAPIAIMYPTATR